jgi:hypothetical protein
MVKRAVVWHGTPDEGAELLRVLKQYCSCHVQGATTLTACSVHRMLAEDQRAVDGLLFARHIATRLLAEESTWR